MMSFTYPSSIQFFCTYTVQISALLFIFTNSIKHVFFIIMKYKKEKWWENKNKNTDAYLPSDTPESISDPKACVFFIGCHNYRHNLFIDHSHNMSPDSTAHTHTISLISWTVRTLCLYLLPALSDQNCVFVYMSKQYDTCLCQLRFDPENRDPDKDKALAVTSFLHHILSTSCLC